MNIFTKLTSHVARHAATAARTGAREAAERQAREGAERVTQRVVKALPPAKPPIALLPPAASLREVGRKVGWVEAGWQRQERAVAALRARSGEGQRLAHVGTWLKAQQQAGLVRHNEVVTSTRQALAHHADGPVVRAAARDLGRTARALEAPTKVLIESSEFILQFVPFRPVFDRLALVKRFSKAYDAVKTDPNSVRRWVKGLADGVPTYRV
jgi:hypothetical protein